MVNPSHTAPDADAAPSCRKRRAWDVIMLGRYRSVRPSGGTMKYVLLIFETPQNLESRRDVEHDPYIAAWRAYDKALRAAGVYGGGAPLKDVGTATTVRLREGQRHVQDGP